MKKTTAFNKKTILLFSLVISLFFLISALAFAIPNSLTLQGKLTNLAGTSQQGTFNFTFKIYDAATNGNELWAVINQSVATDANGIYDIILTGLNLSFADQYYLGIAVQGENESVPRINLTSAPYSFRANTSEALNPNASYFVRNLSITGNATIGDGTTTLAISTQGFNLTTIGNVFVGSNLSVAGNTLFVDSLNNRVGIGTNLPYNTLVIVGSVGISGSLNASSINTTGSAYFATSSGKVGIGKTNPATQLDVAGGINASTLNISGNVFLATQSGNVGIGTTGPGAKLELGSGQLAVPLGSVTAPSYSFTGDLDTGIYSTFANRVAIAAGGVKYATFINGGDSDITLQTGENFAFNVDSAANVFLVPPDATAGVTLRNTPTLDLRGKYWNGASTANLDFSLQTIVSATTPTGRLDFGINGVGGKLVLDNSGNVGIGTTAPGQALHVVGSANISTTLNAPVINTTLSTQNLTISSSAGSVIIRLG